MVNLKQEIMILCTCPDRASSQGIAQHLVEMKLSACVTSIAGVTSTYRWKDKVECNEELLLLIKTTEERYQDIENAIKELHPYDLPEIIALPITLGEKNYLDWLRNNCR